MSQDMELIKHADMTGEESAALNGGGAGRWRLRWRQMGREEPPPWIRQWRPAALDGGGRSQLPPHG